MSSPPGYPPEKHTGFDGGKQIKGIKRTRAVDGVGMVLIVQAHAAGVANRKGGSLLVEHLKANFPTLRQLFADGSYSLVGHSHEAGQSLAVVKQHTHRLGSGPYPSSG